ncbi:MAG: hypothetical protein HN855_16650 [Anaerolineae bacterium]|mgnify:CR=1 FL=1|jgi:hypothetical protein|nr:hypothetical protein [Anaerolineae bacterium]MBT7072130.1 hypothetical protein [Anaerolineae bacterium]MBT7326779.1 hypothetical protein [Anaerolineae bacterium]
MNNLDAILEIAIGLILTWLILSVATMEVQDLFSKWFDKRAQFLEKSILEMFQGDQNYVDLFYSQPVIKALVPKDRSGQPKKTLLRKAKKPDYIPNAAFAEAVFEMFVDLGTEKDKLAEATVSLERILGKIDTIIKENEDLGYFVRRLLPNLDSKKSVSNLPEAHDKVIEFKTNAESWFDTSMKRASFWYKENAKNLAFVIGLVIAAAFNIDSIQITEQLWREPTLRQSLVAQAQVASVNTGADSVAELETYYQDLQLPVGWDASKLPPTPLDWTTKIIGFLISGLAAMQGAPFWFEILKNLLKFKGGSKKESESPPPPATPPATPPVAASKLEAVG